MPAGLRFEFNSASVIHGFVKVIGKQTAFRIFYSPYIRFGIDIRSVVQ